MRLGDDADRATRHHRIAQRIMRHSQTNLLDVARDAAIVFKEAVQGGPRQARFPGENCRFQLPGANLAKNCASNPLAGQPRRGIAGRKARRLASPRKKTGRYRAVQAPASTGISSAVALASRAGNASMKSGKKTGARTMQQPRAERR